MVESETNLETDNSGQETQDKSEWCKEHTLIFDGYTPVEIARLEKYKWPYTEVGRDIEGLAWKAKSRGEEIFCVKVEYCGTKEMENCTAHHARCTAYLAHGMCGHNSIEECIENLEKWKVGPCYPKHDEEACRIIAITNKLRKNGNFKEKLDG